MRALVLLPVLALACIHPIPIKRGASTVQETRVSDPALFKHMVNHIAMATVARDALVMGQTDRARSELAELANHPLAEGLSPAQEAMALVTQQAAARAADATTTTELAMALATTAARCGDCHHSDGIVVQFDTPLPGAGKEIPHHMGRHVVALDLLWEGLVSPSDAAWKKGADALTEDSLTQDEVPHDDVRGHAVDVMGRYVHEMGVEALEVSTSSERAETFARLIATCADCHSESGSTPSGSTP